MELYAIKSWYDNRAGVVELEDDVLSIVRQVREIYGDQVRIHIEPTSGHYVFSENCEDFTERLIFTTEVLDGRVLDRLLSADSQLRGYEDPYMKAEREQDELKAEADKKAMEGIRDAGERLAWAFEEDGKGTHAQIQVERDIADS